MRRLYIVIPEIESAIEITRGLTRLSIPQKNINVLIQSTDKKMVKAKLLNDRLFDKTDLYSSILRGMLIGALLGLLLGYLMMHASIKEFNIQSSHLGWFSFFGALFGGWASSLIGIAVPSPVMEKITAAVKEKAILVLVDIPKEKESELISFMSHHHPEAKLYDRDGEIATH